MFEFPMFRVDSKEYLEKLKQGEIFMKNSLCYQQFDSNDSARSDKYDGSIPANVSNPFPLMMQEEIQNPRIMMGISYIKCFTHYKRENCGKIQDGIHVLTLPKDVRDALSEFASSHVLIIFKPSQMVKQFEEACKAKSLDCLYSDVLYLTAEEQREQEIKLLSKELKVHPALMKSERFKFQQEFRFCVKFPLKEGEIKETFTMNIGSIEKISSIVPFSDFIKHPLLIDVKNKKYRLLTEVLNEDIEK